jgi:hypothetical protein
MMKGGLSIYSKSQRVGFEVEGGFLKEEEKKKDEMNKKREKKKKKTKNKTKNMSRAADSNAERPGANSKLLIGCQLFNT